MLIAVLELRRKFGVLVVERLERGGEVRVFGGRVVR
jgi:hypothetical protein